MLPTRRKNATAVKNGNGRRHNGHRRTTNGKFSGPADIAWSGRNEASVVLTKLASAPTGLATAEARHRLLLGGHNEVVTEKEKEWYHRLWRNLRDPLSVLLAVLGLISYLTGDLKASTLIAFMLSLSVGLRYIQETRADRAAEKLKAMVRTTAAVLRDGEIKEISLRNVVPGDIVHLNAGDLIPADLRLFEARDFFVNQAALTGESLPVEKSVPPVAIAPAGLLDLPNVCFMGTSVASGTGRAVVLATGRRTRFGQLAADTASKTEGPTAFDRGVSGYTWLMIRFVAIMVPTVFLINGFAKGDWFQAFLFGLAVAVGLTPELLPMIVTVNLSKGALEMSRLKVIVKRLNAIQDIGAMDVLCTDKTGTLTHGRVALIRHVDLSGRDSERVYDYGYINSFYQTGLANLLDEAVLKHDKAEAKNLAKLFRKIDEIPFDFKRRRMSVVVADPEGRHLLICKGAVEEMLAGCRRVQEGDRAVDLAGSHRAQVTALVEKLSGEGFRLIALGLREMPPGRDRYGSDDETDLTLLGFLAFLDPPKASAGRAIAELTRYGVAVKILTGDNEIITRKICAEVGLAIPSILRGHEVEGMDDDTLSAAAEKATVFDKLEPSHKERIIRALQRRGHVVGFLGDGINDAPALKAADVGISVDGATDIAKESSDIILLERSLMVLKDGVIEGRRAFANIVKYIKMTASSNFGNMFSVVGASIFLPFLPLLPIQIITNNLLYDLSQTPIPTDRVDGSYLTKPRQWKIEGLRRFILYIGPVSSLFDYATFALMLWVFHAWGNPALFRSGWFVESLFSQTLIIHIIRTADIPFFKSRASLPLTLTGVGIVGLGAYLPYSPFAAALGFAALPIAYWAWLAGLLIVYLLMTQAVKSWFIRKYGWD